MIKIPYIRIRQRSETFYLTKFRSDILLKCIDFHFREPYSDLNAIDVQLKTTEYLDKIKKQGIAFQSSEEGIQRRLQYDRIKNIAEFLSSDESNFVPNSILLSATIDPADSFFDRITEAENTDHGFFEFPDTVRFNVIDGQHRLAGIFLLDPTFQQSIELAVVLLFNISMPTAAKLFSDINGKQKPVNKSLIYDLYDLIGKEYENTISKFHSICEAFYTSKTSPLYRQIKMLGTGSGAISQAFFIDYVMSAVNKVQELRDSDTQKIYDQLFYFFRAFQKNFPEDWPVPLKFETINDLENHAKHVLKERKSQLVKTNGFGAIMNSFPKVYRKAHGDAQKYQSLIEQLVGKIKWIADDNTGTGRAFQNKLTKDIDKVLNLENETVDKKYLINNLKEINWQDLIIRADVIRLNEYQYVALEHPDLNHPASILWDGKKLLITTFDNPEIKIEHLVSLRESNYLVLNPHFERRRWLYRILVERGRIHLELITGASGIEPVITDNQTI